MNTRISQVKSGQTIVLRTDDRPSATMKVTVSGLSRHEYSFGQWYEVIDTDGNHWQFSLDEMVELAS